MKANKHLTLEGLDQITKIRLGIRVGNKTLLRQVHDTLKEITKMVGIS